ncbi:hypothetical protein EZV63_04110 [Streptomyces sp. VN1]|nr:hypothetical protein EZV63_04110 [Streptomyces sp. VN1]
MIGRQGKVIRLLGRIREARDRPCAARRTDATTGTETGAGTGKLVHAERQSLGRHARERDESPRDVVRALLGLPAA